MTIDTAFAGAVAAIPAPRPYATRDAADDLPDVAHWQIYAAAFAGLLGGALMVAGIAFPW